MGYAFASVVETVQLNKRLRRIVLEVSELDRLQLPKAGDAAVGIYFPDANRPKRPPPMECRDGVWGYYDATTAPPGRTYSIRNHDPIANRINVDVVLHGHGVGSTWAQTAAVASEVVVAHARSWYRPGPTTDWQLLVADLAGLPAAARIVEELAPDNEAIAIVEVAEEADLEYLPHRTNVTVIATVGTGNGDGESVLAQLVAAQPLPSGRGYCWFAGEAGQSRAVRKYLRGRHHWDAAQFDILGYWRRDSEAWDKRYAPVASDLFAVYEKALADGKSDKLASEEFDDALEQAGL
jgi:NADPH-dependent ferric siderophore reductase